MSLKHYHEENHYYFITTVTADRRPIFHDKLACELFINLLIYYKFKCTYNLFAFVIMPDHVHIIIQPLGEDNISVIMKRIKGSFSRFYNKLNNTTGSVLQKGFHDTVIRNEGHFLETINYIHNNPMENGMVEEREDYYYSSYRYFYEDDGGFALLLNGTFE